MLKKLQRKFVLFTTLISVSVMLFIAIAINIMNYNSVISYSDEVLAILVNDDLQAPDRLPAHQKFPAEFQFTTRFFKVMLNEDGEFDYIDIKNISSVSFDEAKNYVTQVVDNGQATGTVDNFRYIQLESSLGDGYIFLDIEKDLIGFESSLLYSVLIVSAAVVLIFIVACLLSKKVVSPIAESYEKQKRFITDVSHEFKTPLTIIKADCDVLELDNGEGEWTDSIKSQVVRLDTLVGNLVSLAKLDEEKAVVIKTDFSLSDVICDTLSEFNASIKNANLELNTKITQNISYNGDEALIRELFSILIENAIKYSKGDLNATLTVAGGKKIFTLQNACEEIAIGKHSNWFERFYRVDKSRNSEVKGFGVGLSIAKAICDKHGAKITAESKTGSEIIVTVTF